MKESIRKNLKVWALDAPVLVIGTALVALGLVMFTVPNDIAPGGVSGLATVLAYLFGALTVGTWTFLLNIPLLLLAAWRMGIRPLIKTLISTALLSAFIDLLTLFVPTYTNNPLLAACLGGAIMGVGLGILFIRGISTGGTDLLSMLLNRAFPNLSVSTLLMLVDATVVVFAVIVFRNIEVALYSFVTIFVTSKTIDSVMQGYDHAKVIQVVTERSEVLLKTLTEELGRGVTVLPARGGYTGREKQMLMVVARRNEFSQTLGIIKRIDPSAFVIVSSASEVHGEGFKTGD